MGSDSSKAGRNAAQQQENRPEAFQYGPPTTTQNRVNNNVQGPSSGNLAPVPQPRPRVPPVPPRSSDLPPSYSSIAPSASDFADPQKFPTTTIRIHSSHHSTTSMRQYCFGCNQITDHIDHNCPNLFCHNCDEFGHSSADCKLQFQGILQPEVLHSAPPTVPSKVIQAAPAPAAAKVVQASPQNAANLHHFSHDLQPKVIPTKAPAAALPSVPVRPSRGKQIDLSKEMPRIIEQMKSNKLPNYQNFKQQLCKNKPVKDVRSSMVNNKYLSDVKFIINGSPFYAHKMALITTSFLFYDHFHTKGLTELKVEFIDIETFEMLIKYCYSEQLKVTEENVLELLKGANQLQIRQVTNVCHGFITSLMNADSIFVIFEKAIEIEYEIFQKKCLDFIKNNEEKCFASKGFFAISLPSLLKVLEACKYSREKENEIVEKWTNGDMRTEEEAAEKTPEVKPTPPFPSKAAKATPKAQKKKQQPKIPPCPVPYPYEQPPIPDLMSIPVPDPNTGLPFPNPFTYEPAFMPTFPINPQRPFAKQYQQGARNFGSNPNLGTIPPNPLCAPNAGPTNKKPKAKPKAPKLIVVDDGNDFGGETSSGIKIEVLGMRDRHETEFSRLDLFCTRSMLIHEIFFTENLAARCGDVRVTITALEQGKPTDLHIRNVKISSGMKMNFIKFSRDPLKVYAGMKFSIKVNFDAKVMLTNVNADSLLLNPLVKLNEDNKKKYFNCVSSLTVSDMLTA